MIIVSTTPHSDGSLPLIYAPLLLGQVISLGNATTIDDDVVDFTNKDGWPRTDKLLPLVSASWYITFFELWVNGFRQFTDDLNVRDLSPLFGSN